MKRLLLALSFFLLLAGCLSPTDTPESATEALNAESDMNAPEIQLTASGVLVEKAL